MGIQMIPGGFLFVGMLFQQESPRYLILHDRLEEATHNLVRIRKLPLENPFVQTELHEITESVMAEKRAVGGASFLNLLKEVVFVTSNRRRYILAILLQIFQQMTGTNAINYFAPSIFASVGLTGTSTSVLATGVYGIVKVCTTLIYVFFIVDNVGRRRPLMTGAAIQASSLLYLTVFVKLANPKAGAPVTAGGYVGVIAIYIYAFGWSFGWSVIPWVVPSEIFPNRIRAVSMSSVYAFQWLLNFGITHGTPYMMLNMHKWGAYLLFSIFTFGSVAWTFFFFPELRGRSIESMDNLFDKSSFTMLKRAYPTEEEKTRHENDRDSDAATVESQIEKSFAVEEAENRSH